MHVSSNEVALAAVIVSAGVGFGAPFLVARFESRRQKDAFDAETERLDKTLLAEAERLDRTLAAEAVRLDRTLASETERLDRTLLADRQRASFEVEREVLDATATFIQRASNFFSKQPGPTIEEFEDMKQALGEHYARLRLWFSDDSEIVQSFSLMLWAGGKLAFEGKDQTQEQRERLQKGVNDARTTFLDAAKAHLEARLQ